VSRRFDIHDPFRASDADEERGTDGSGHDLLHLRELAETKARAGRVASELLEGLGELLAVARGFIDSRLSDAELDRRLGLLLRNKNLSDYGVDPFGFSPVYLRRILPLLQWVYRVYFRVESFNVDRVGHGRVLLISNHSGQIPIDGAMIAGSVLLDLDPPRMTRAMIEKWAPTLPFVSTFFARCGQLTGLPENCRRLLESDEAVLVFPEGSRGISKTFKHRYKLSQFGTGFMRLALETGTPVVPVAVVGAEEQVINLYDWRALARLVGAPAFPITPLTPLLGPLGMWPLPVKYRIYFGEPMVFDGDPNEDDEVISGKVRQVRDRIQTMLDDGVRTRRGVFV